MGGAFPKIPLSSSTFCLKICSDNRPVRRAFGMKQYFCDVVGRIYGVVKLNQRFNRHKKALVNQYETTSSFVGIFGIGDYSQKIGVSAGGR